MQSLAVKAQVRHAAPTSHLEAEGTMRRGVEVLDSVVSPQTTGGRVAVF
jgi:hypothetical protein